MSLNARAAGMAFGSGAAGPPPMPCYPAAATLQLPQSFGILIALSAGSPSAAGRSQWTGVGCQPGKYQVRRELLIDDANFRRARSFTERRSNLLRSTRLSIEVNNAV